MQFAGTRSKRILVAMKRLDVRSRFIHHRHRQFVLVPVGTGKHDAHVDVAAVPVAEVSHVGQSIDIADDHLRVAARPPLHTRSERQKAELKSLKRRSYAVRYLT